MILLIAFNNEDTTGRVLERVRAAAPSRLYFAVDGPRADVPADAEAVARVRRLTERIDWRCEVATLFPDSNRGPRQAVRAALSWFFDHEAAGIVLEHDCLPDPSFFAFCQTMLDRYAHDERVMHVSGNFFQRQPVGVGSYYFSRIPHIWGWATWRRAWRHYDVAMGDWGAYRDAGRLESSIPWWWQRQKWRYILNKVSRPTARTWDYQWTYTLFKHQGLAVTPNVNLVSNIGFGPGAVHGTNPRSRFANLPVASIREPLVEPDAVVADDAADLFTCRNNFRFRATSVAVSRLADAFGFAR